MLSFLEFLRTSRYAREEAHGNGSYEKSVLRNPNRFMQPRTELIDGEQFTVIHVIRRAGGVLAFAIASAYAISAGAQSLGVGDVLDEIVVTATRRAENIQDVPIAISAFTGDTLRTLGITRADELMNVTPGLRLQEGGGGPLLGLLSIRGVSQNDFAGHIESPNALYMDDVYQPSATTSAQQFYDVDRIEVLKGPQGTLFGRNATGGLVHIISRKPTDTLEGYAIAGVGSYNQLRVETALGGPLSESVSGRFSGLYNKSNGYFKNAIGPDLNEDHTRAGRLQIRVRPNEKLDALFSGSIYKLGPQTTGGAYVTAGAPDENGLGHHLPPGSPTLFGYVDADGDPFTGAFDEPGNIERRQNDASARIAYHFDNGVVLHSVTSYSTLKSRYIEDNDLSPVPLAVFRQDSDGRYVTQELRLEGSAGRARWTGGGFYLSVDGEYMQGYDILPIDTVLQADYAIDTRSWSGFAQMEYDLPKQFMLTAGARYTYDNKNYDYLRSCSGACELFSVPDSIGVAGAIADKHGEGDWSGRLALDYKPHPGSLYYLSVNRGYKAFNYNAGFAGMAPLSGVRFRGETLLAYEIGTKLQFWNDRARFNGALFYYDYSHYQAFDQRGQNFTLFNADATVYGADFELSLRPGAGVTVELGTSLLHTEVSDVPIGALRVTREAPQSPHATFMGALAKEFNVGGLRLLLSANGAYTTEFYAQLTNAPVTRMPPDFIMNARVGLSDSRDRYELSVTANNLLNRHRALYAFDITGPPMGYVENSMAPPRWIRVDARVRF